jgi:hypothetical protein
MPAFVKDKLPPRPLASAFVTCRPKAHRMWTKEIKENPCISIKDALHYHSLEVQCVFVINKVQKSRPHKPAEMASAVFLCAKTGCQPNDSA